jgi:hypothetical protein
MGFGMWDPRSEIRKKTYSGSQIHGGVFAFIRTNGTWYWRVISGPTVPYLGSQAVQWIDNVLMPIRIRIRRSISMPVGMRIYP